MSTQQEAAASADVKPNAVTSHAPNGATETTSPSDTTAPAAGGAAKTNINSMWGGFVRGMVPVITRVVNFSKQLPGSYAAWCPSSHES